jgi:uncharacterized protein
MSDTERRRPGFFADSEHENLGALGFLGVGTKGGQSICYAMDLNLNGFALPSTRQPRDFVMAFKGVRLWNDTTDPHPNMRDKRLGDGDQLDRKTVVRVLEAQRDGLGRFGVKSLRLFGSAARGESDAASDLDLIVELDPETFANYASLTEFLEGLFGCRVDLVMKDAIKPALRGSIFRESVEAARL